MSETLPPEVRKLVLEHIHSVDQLDVLLLCHRTRDREWTAREVADELRTNLQMSSAALSDLSYRGFVAMVDTTRQSYRYQPGDPAMDRTVGSLAALYPMFRHRVIELIFTRGKSDIQDFADAFKIKKD